MKKQFIYVLLGFIASFGVACSNQKKEIALADLYTTATHEPMGVVKFYQDSKEKIRMELELNLPEKADSVVAVHFHEHGDCGNMGENAHGHWNPTNEEHGEWGSASYHSGDIGNIELNREGYAKITVSTDRWSIKEGDVKNIIGRGIIVHGGTDDYVTQPTGNSGPRIGCGVIAVVN